VLDSQGVTIFFVALELLGGNEVFYPELGLAGLQVVADRDDIDARFFEVADRLFDLFFALAKPSVMFGGHYRLIDIPLSNSLNSRVNQIFVISQYFAAELHQHILSTYQLDMFRTGRLELLTPQETMEGQRFFKGTADAVRQNLDTIMKCQAEYFLILSGDQLYNMDLLDLLAFAEKQESDLVIAALSVKEAEARRMGVLNIDKNAHITEFYEKPHEPAILKRFEQPDKHYLASMGIYIFKREALIRLLQKEGDDFGKHLIPEMIKEGRSSAYTYKGYWEDIGTVSSYYLSNLLITEGKGMDLYQEDNRIYSHPLHIPSALVNGTQIERSLISQGAIIEAKEITRSIVGVRCKVGKGTVIQDSIINGNRSYHPLLENSTTPYFSIGEHCLIKKAIIDEETRIGNGVQLINKNNLQTYDGDGVYIRDGIIIVTSGTELPDKFVL